ncbi:hypothetical protein pb186bvf_006413 [Paramecium bursaria]
MPSSRRVKKVSLTKATKKTSEHKQNLVENVKKGLKQYKTAIVFEYRNLTNNPLKQMREDLKPNSKIFIGKNKVMQVALGKDEEKQAGKNTYLLSQHLKGQTGLLLTNQDVDKLQAYLSQFDSQEFAQPGLISPETIILKSGLETFSKFQHTMDPYLRQLGLNTKLMNQQIVLNEDFKVCEAGKPISVEQGKILRLLNIKLGKLEITPKFMLNLKNGSFKKVQ